MAGGGNDEAINQHSTQTVKTTDFHFDLPKSLIAQRPAPVRSASRLLRLRIGSGETSHHRFTDLPDLLDPKDLLVFNNTKVLPARLQARKASGGQAEILLERFLAKDQALAQVKASKAPKPGAELLLEGGAIIQILGRQQGFFRLQFPPPGAKAIFKRHGRTPLPPYIDRRSDAADQSRYQTVYAKLEGAVAAPTAGLHFDEPLLAQLAAKGIASCELTLHVGAGTFQPLRTEDLSAHQMHSEQLQVSEAVCQAVTACRQRQGRVVAVGTTSVRSLETAAAATGKPEPYTGETDLFIYPGYEFRVVDALVTNFHLPGSTLLMLVCALAGREQTLHAYRLAVQEAYRFFSYGDAMLITP